MPTESFFSQSSLAYIASAGAGKDGKAYSIKPTDGTGDFAFSRGSNLAATRVGADGFIEKGRENLLTYSNDFSNAAWINSSTTVTSGQEDPLGGTNGWRYLMNAVGGSFLYQNNRTINGSPMVLSFWVKSNTGSAQTFVATANSGSQGSPTFTATTSWQRFSWFFVSNAGGSNILLAYNASTNCDLLIYAAQFESGLVSTSYITSGATTGTAGILENTPRFDYSNGASCPSLLLEPSRTQLIEYSEYFDAWIKGRSSVVSNAALSPEGLGNASYLYDTTDVGTHRIYTSNVQLLTNGQSQSITLYAKSGTFFNLRMSIKQNNEADLGFGTFDFDLTEGTCSNSNGSIESIGNDGWYKCTAVGSVNASVSAKMWVYLLNDSGSQSYAGTGNDYLQIFGAQWESNASYPTSYIPNHSGGTITRAEDDGSSTSIINNTNFTIYGEIELYRDGSDFYGRGGALLFNYSKNGVSEFNHHFIVTRRLGDLMVSSRNGLGDNDIITSNFTLPINIKHKYAISYKIGQGVTFALNGTTEVVNNSNLPELYMDEINFRSYNDDPMEANLSSQIIFPTALSDADCITLTTI